MVKCLAKMRVARFAAASVVTLSFVIGSLVATSPNEAQADGAYCVVVSIKNNAWVTRKDATVKASLKIGDRLRPGDRLEVYNGSAVDLAFDKESYNILHIKGETYLEITALSPTDITVEDKKGNVFALMDNLDSRQQFRVQTPSAIAAVRGTQFQVMYQNGQTNVTTYDGAVKVFGRDASGNPTLDYVLVKEGEKTSVRSKGAKPEKPVPLTASDMRDIDAVRVNAKDLREWLQNKGFSNKVTRDEQRERDRKKTRIIKDEKEDSSVKSKDGVVYF